MTIMPLKPVEKRYVVLQHAIGFVRDVSRLAFHHGLLRHAFRS
jgi:hypothetical protein